MKRLLLALGLLFIVPLLAHAQPHPQPIDYIQVDPAIPRENEPFDILVGGYWPSGSHPRDPRVTVAGDRIIIDMPSTFSGPLMAVEWGERIRFGGLPAGPYRIEVQTGETTKTRQIHVMPKPFTLLPLFGLGGTEVLIEGVPLRPCVGPLICNPVRVFFGEKEASNVRVTNDGNLLVIVPTGSGRVDVRVRNYDSTELRLRQGFTYGVVGDPEDFEKVLFPMTFAGAGAHGSQWRSENIVRNDAPVGVDTEPFLNGVITLAPGARARMHELPADGGGFLYVIRDSDKWLTYSSHVVDRSRSAIDRGSELPVVRAEDTSAEIRLIDVPLRNLYRAKLRIYDFDTFRDRLVYVTITTENGTQVQVERTLSNGDGPCLTGPCFPHHPPYATVDLSSIQGLVNVGEVDISVRAETNDARLWAFVSVSNNETQHVTMYTPQHKGAEVVR